MPATTFPNEEGYGELALVSGNPVRPTRLT
jgi:hypothetical protein